MAPSAERALNVNTLANVKWNFEINLGYGSEELAY
jgi:hypothetical protein